MSTLELMDGALADRPRIDALVQVDDEKRFFNLPLWFGDDGLVRIAFPKRNPQHVTDVGIIAMRPSALLNALSLAAEEDEDNHGIEPPVKAVTACPAAHDSEEDSR